MPILSEQYKMRPRHNWFSKIIRKYYKIRVNLTKPKNPIPDNKILEKVERDKQLIIQVPFGGLGDHLTYSSLPELLWKQKGIKTLISNESIFRSKAIRDFVWVLNPYIDFTDKKGWFIHRPLVHEYSTLDEYFQNLLDLQGNGHPKIYYEPRIIEMIKGKTIIDPSFGPSGKANGYYEADFLKKFIDYLKNNIDEFVLVIHKHDKMKNKLEEQIKKMFNVTYYEVKTIENLADVLYSAEKRYLLYSGTSSLSAAMNLPSIVLCNRKAVPTFQYKTNNYVDLMR